MCSVYMYGLQGVCVIKCVYVWRVSQTKLILKRVFSRGAGVGCHKSSNISKPRAGGALKHVISKVNSVFACI